MSGFPIVKGQNGTLVYNFQTPSNYWEVITRVTKTTVSEDQGPDWDNPANVLSDLWARAWHPYFRTLS